MSRLPVRFISAMHGHEHVVHLTSVHQWTDARIFLKECQTLATAGYAVTLVAPAAPDQECAGVSLRGVARPRDRWERLLKTTRRVARRALEQEARICHIHDPELLPVGLALKLRGRRVVYDVHEDYPAVILNKHWIPRAVRWPLSVAARLVEWGAALALDGIVAATPAIARKFPAHKTVVVQNFPRAEEFDSTQSPPYADRPLVVCYSGLLSEHRAIREMIAAMALLPVDLGCRLVLAGRFEPPALQHEVQREPGWQFVHYHGWLSRSQVRDLLNCSRVGLVLCYPDSQYFEAQPTKLFEYMAAGLPVIASDFPLWRQIVDSARCGLLVDPRDPHQIADAIQWILCHPYEAEEMGTRGRQAALARYTWDSEARVLLDLYEQLIAPRD